MEILGSVVLIVLAIGLFELAAVVWGAEPRERVGDDHLRQPEGGV